MAAEGVGQRVHRRNRCIGEGLPGEAGPQQHAGARIPPERVLAEELRVSRADLRKALLVLETEGRLDRQVGRGTFVRDPSQAGLADAAKLALLLATSG